MLYIGVTLLRWPERDVWHMTPYKIITLFNIHKTFNPDRFEQPKPEGMAEIDYALGGL